MVSFSACIFLHGKKYHLPTQQAITRRNTEWIFHWIFLYQPSIPPQSSSLPVAIVLRYIILPLCFCVVPLKATQKLFLPPAHSFFSGLCLLIKCWMLYLRLQTQNSVVWPFLLANMPRCASLTPWWMDDVLSKVIDFFEKINEYTLRKWGAFSDFWGPNLSLPGLC